MKILFVCLGNICRSPSCEIVARHFLSERKISNIEVDSCGISDWHKGQRPDPRVLKICAQRQYIIPDSCVSRPIAEGDFRCFDLILAADKSNLKSLESLKPNDSKSEVRLFLSFDQDSDPCDLEDTYYYGLDRFDVMFNIIEKHMPYIVEYALKQ